MPHFWLINTGWNVARAPKEPAFVSGIIFLMGDGRIEAVIFDLGRVLVQVDVLTLARQVLAGRPHADPSLLIERVMTDPIMAAYNTGRITSVQFHAALCERLGLEVDFDAFRRMWCGIFGPMAGMAELVAELRGRVRLGLLSDTDPLHWGFLRENYPFLAWFERPTLSFQVGAMKPDPRIYRTAIGNVGTACDRCLYVDDLPANVEGARAVGMRGILFEGPAALRRTLAEHGLVQQG